MFKFMKSDPLKKAKKLVEKALEELEEGYPDYASTAYEKAARIFHEEEEIDFAVKYFREAAYCALEHDNHYRGAEMKIAAAECLFLEGRYDEGAGLYSESSDHFHREKKTRESNRSLGIAIIGYLGARNFATATNLQRKAEKRLTETSTKTTSDYELAKLCVTILCDGTDVEKKDFEKIAGAAKPNPSEETLVSFVINSVRLALETEVTLDWAGKAQNNVPVKTTVELELQFKCPADVHVTDHRVSLSNSVIILNEPEFRNPPSKQESWLIEFKPVLSGDGIIGPYTVTLEGDKVLVHKHSNVIKFNIARAPSDLALNVSPERVSCSLNDEDGFEIELKNVGDGPADNIHVRIELSEGLEISLGSAEKTINFIGSGDQIRFQIYVRAISQGDELITVHAVDGRTGQEVSQTSMVRIG
ncbi:MAG: hypothetical protein E4H14_06415 [Candidatus Thorarchaeota archaeon]|nr:MAG: hypothetical protein E4H14_06415 [Candidatus Thorarchaeota archaeon]